MVVPPLVVHHLFPQIGWGHYTALAPIIKRTCQEHGVKYTTAHSFFKVYKEMVHSFQTPQSLYKEIMVYGKL